MLLWIFRTIFVIIVLSVLFVSISTETITRGENAASFWAVVFSGLGMAVFVFLLDIFTPKRKLSALAGVFFGLLVGLLISGALAPLVDMITDTYRLRLLGEAVSAIKWMLGVCICYLTISVVIRTKDDVRFVVPYVEFAKQTKGARPLVLDTSVIIDGRVADLCRSKFFDAPVVIPRFVLNELQIIADSSDRLKRNRGRRGLDIIKEMQSDSATDVEIDDTAIAESEDVRGVDQKIIAFTKMHNGRLATTDYNLTKVAQVREVDVINVNDLANSLKAIALPGETLEVRIVKPGEEAEQGVGYLPDGTMVVVDGGRDKIGKEVTVNITSSLQTSAGKMIFGKYEGYTQDKNNRYRPSEKREDTTAEY
jgi:uncharacterized protein YacL